MQSGEFEPAETQLVSRILRSVDVFINVGANVGYYCCIALSQGKYVVAFEPMNANLRLLLRNVRANDWSQIEVYPMAVGDRVGVLEIYGGGVGASLVKGWAGTSERYVSLVPSTTLNDALHGRFRGKRCLILVDVEGAERAVLEGASSIVQMQPRPIWMMEVSVTEHQPRGIAVNPDLSSTFQLFWSHGYEAWTADERCRIVHPDEIEQVVGTGADTLHTHNFLFIEKGRKHEFLGAALPAAGRAEPSA
jgi:FkbM family methyltransferase